MGLDIVLYEKTAIDGFRAGSYSGFGLFRSVLAESVGIVLNDKDGFGGSIEWTESDTYQELLNHSDCEGILPSWDCEELLEDFTPENRTRFENTLKDNGDEYLLEKWDLWKNIIEKCVEIEGEIAFG